MVRCQSLDVLELDNDTAIHNDMSEDLAHEVASEASGKRLLSDSVPALLCQRQGRRALVDRFYKKGSQLACNLNGARVNLMCDVAKQPCRARSIMPVHSLIVPA